MGRESAQTLVNFGKNHIVFGFVKNTSNKSRIFAINLDGLPLCLEIRCRCDKASGGIFQNYFN